MLPKLILQGDKKKAIRWIPWAKNTLLRLKGISDTVNQILRPKVGIAIHVRSGGGIDSIRIAALKIGGCSASFTADVLSGGNPLTVNFTGIGKTAPNEDGDGFTNKWLWSFGGNEYGGGWNNGGGEQGNLLDDDARQIYYIPGTYTVSLKTWRQSPGEEAYIAETSTSSVEKKSDPAVQYSSNADAHTSFASRPWLATTYKSPAYYASRQDDGISAGVDRYFYDAVKTTVTVRLSTIPAKSISFMKGNFQFPAGTDSPSSFESFPLVKNGANTIAQKDPRGGAGSKAAIADLTSFGQVDTILEILDNTDYAILGPPNIPNGLGGITRNGWRWLMTPQLGARQSFKYSQYKCLATSTRSNYITVT